VFQSLLCFSITTFAAQFFQLDMKTDKNTVIGFVLLGILFFLFFWYTNKQQQAAVAEQKRIQDSIARLETKKVKPVDTATARLDSIRFDSASKATVAGNFQNATAGQEQIVTVENELLKANFSTKGGSLKSVELKKFKSYDSTQVLIGGTPQDKLGYAVNTAPNQSAYSYDLNFTPSTVTKNTDGSQTISFSLNSASGQSITHKYVIKPNSYLIDWNIGMNGAAQLLTKNTLNLNWEMAAKQHQQDINYERQQSRLTYYEDDNYDFEHAAEGATYNLEKAAKWAGFKQQFFNATIIAPTNFASGQMQLTKQSDSTHVLFNSAANLKVNVPAANTVSVPLQLYYGPTDYDILKSQNLNLEQMVDLGSGVFSFVKYINRWIIKPVFDFFASFISNYGWVILLLTLFIRLVTAPLTYSSYLSGAKMKVLRPELDILKKKHGDDKQAFAMDQMKLFREAGVNPLGGCIPALLQIPIFFALYAFFNSNIDLRGQEFLWSHDLSQYDVIAKLPFTIPLGFGDHISLFTLTAVITSFFISLYSMNSNMTPDQNNPMLKYMPYIFPFVMLFIFNKLPSALTWYYTVSNLITLILQFIIQNYIIDHEKVLAKIDLKRKTPKQKSKWQTRYDEMMESQKKVQELKNRTNKK
jgi:YidC/Oxa1 family membrane protein insertase